MLFTVKHENDAKRLSLKQCLFTVVCVFAGLALSGCLVVKPREVSLVSNYDADQAKKLLQKGSNTIEGSALMRQRNGGVVTCGGFSVSLFPRTAHASERIQHLYGNTTRGVRYWSAPKINFTPNLPQYLANAKEVICDAQGKFKFRNVADGTFYVTAAVAWEVPSTSPYVQPSQEGGYLMQQVTVSGGEIKEIVLAP